MPTSGLASVVTLDVLSLSSSLSSLPLQALNNSRNRQRESVSENHKVLFARSTRFSLSNPSSMAPTPSSAKLPEYLKTLEPFFLLSPEKLKAITQEFQEEYAGGLAAYGQDMAMVPSFVTGVPDGTETGSVTLESREIYADAFRSTFLALDLGGTNL